MIPKILFRLVLLSQERCPVFLKVGNDTFKIKAHWKL